MALFSFSIKGESFHSGRLESKSRKFDLDIDSRLPVKSIDHTISSVAFFCRIDELAETLNDNLYSAAAAEDISIKRLQITIAGNIVRGTVTGRKKSRSFGNIDIAIDITSDAADRILAAVLAKARTRTQALKNIKNTKFNYSFNSIVHLN